MILDQTLPAPSISYSQARQQYDLPDSFYTLVQDYVVVQDGWRDPVMLNCQPTDSFVRNPMTSHHWLARSVSKCFKICRLESYQRLTQLLMHVSSLPASFPVVIELVMHFLKQISARECVFFAIWLFCCSLCRNTWSCRCSLGESRCRSSGEMLKSSSMVGA